MKFRPSVGPMRRPATFLTIFILLLPFSVVAGGSMPNITVMLEPLADTSVFEEGVLSNGGGEYLFTGLIATGPERRALLRFDLSSIPEGATIQTASLGVSVSRTISGTVSVRMHRLLATWGEGTVDAPGQEGTGAPALAGDATWFERNLGTSVWVTPGGDFDPVETARSGLRDVGRYDFAAAAIADDVQRWVDQPMGNPGWILIGNPAAGFGSAKRLNSRENPDPASRPLLTITYSVAGVVIPPPAVIPLGGGGWLVLLILGTLLIGRRFADS